MKIGDRVRLSPRGRRHISNEWDGGGTVVGLVDFLLDPEVRATVVRPGAYRGGLRVHLLVDGRDKPGSFLAAYWEPDRGSM